MHILRASEQLVKRNVRVMALNATRAEDGLDTRLRRLAPVKEPPCKLADLAEAQRARVVGVELYKELSHLVDLVTVAREVLLPCRADLDAVGIGPCRVSLRQGAKRMDYWLRFLLIDLMQERSEDAPGSGNRTPGREQATRGRQGAS